MTKSAESFYKGFLITLLANCLMWVRSSYGKWTSGNFVETLGATLGKFASKNPNPTVKDFLTSNAIPNSITFGWLTLLGETLAGFGALFALVYLLFRGPNRPIVYLLLVSLLTGAFLNLVFWLAAGWTSVSTDGLNLLMLAVQVIGFVFALKLLKK